LQSIECSFKFFELRHCLLQVSKFSYRNCNYNAHARFSDGRIKYMCRWHSDSYLRYVRVPMLSRLQIWYILVLEHFDWV
jgi:hypothetical protein